MRPGHQPVEEFERLLLARDAPRLCHPHAADKGAAERAVIHKGPGVEVEEEELGGSGCAWPHVFERCCVGVERGYRSREAGGLVQVLRLGDEVGNAVRWDDGG